MRLGITSATYQWLPSSTGGTYFVDRTSTQYDWRGLPHPYFLSTPTTIPTGEFFEFLAGRCINLGVPVVHGSLSSWEPDYVQRMQELLRTNNLEMMPSVGVDIVGDGAHVSREIDKAVEEVQRYGALGDVKISKFCTNPMTHNRFRNDPPLDEQLESITANIRPIVKAAESAGIVLAFENHLDYRAKEIVQIIEAVDSPNLRFLFDTGNPFSVCEDPVDAAEAAAPYTVLVHLKDVRVVPWSPSSLGYFACMFATPLGQGNVDNDRIVEIFSERSPNSDDLCLSLELTPMPPHTDEDKWVVEGIKHAKERYAKYLH